MIFQNKPVFLKLFLCLAICLGIFIIYQITKYKPQDWSYVLKTSQSSEHKIFTALADETTARWEKLPEPWRDSLCEDYIDLNSIPKNLNSKVVVRIKEICHAIVLSPCFHGFNIHALAGVDCNSQTTTTGGYFEISRRYVRDNFIPFEIDTNMCRASSQREFIRNLSISWSKPKENHLVKTVCRQRSQ